MGFNRTMQRLRDKIGFDVLEDLDEGLTDLYALLLFSYYLRAYLPPSCVALAFLTARRKVESISSQYEKACCTLCTVADVCSEQVSAENRRPLHGGNVR
jgi:hypothetical protein